MVRICFVCLGNICRSPTAEAVMRHLVKQAGLGDRIAIDSAGTGDWHVGHARDRRSRAVGEARGIPLSGAARQFVPDDFDDFDHVLAMDRANRDELLQAGPQRRAIAPRSRSCARSTPARRPTPRSPTRTTAARAGSTRCSTSASGPAAGCSTS